MRIDSAVATVSVLVLMSSAGFSQSPAAPPAFEAAVVRVNHSGETRAQGSRVRGGQLTWTNLTLKTILSLTYTEDFTGGPNWLESDRFDIVAKSPADTPVETVRLMLQTLLVQRFKLVTHREEKNTVVYALVVGKKGPHLQTAAASGPPVCNPGEGIDGLFHRTCTNMTMKALAETLPGLARGYFSPDSNLLRPRAVMDSTGLTGSYDFRLDWIPQPVDRADLAAGPTIFDAVDKLGLKLEERKQPMPIIAIDHVDRVPEEN
jgi:uncharacterized protein (TIGR03435 family)